MPRRVEAKGATRIDFAGGTIDLWPLYLLHDAPLTVNAAIDLYATATVEAAGDGVEIISIDRQSRLGPLRPGALAAAVRQAPAELEFPVRLAAHFLGGGAGAAPGTGCRITTDCRAPAGSGLGGSSALGIALAAALDRFTGRGLDPERLLAVTRAIETQVLRIPTGEQDYHPALRGGVLALHYTVEGTRAERLGIDTRALRERLVLVYTGVSRSSGISNWDMLKRHLDGDPVVRGALEGINRAAHAMREALLRADWDGAAAALAGEWRERRHLSDKVSSPEIDRIIEGASKAGSLAGKVCGAGGGGCLVLFVGEGARRKVENEVARLGGRILEFAFVDEGVSVTEV
jgi:D-glycero-alpha-D-manno-heptose-7-phosphate kinase